MTPDLPPSQPVKPKVSGPVAQAVQVPEINKLITAVDTFVRADLATNRHPSPELTRQFAEVFLQQSCSEMPTPCPLLYSGPGTTAQRQLWNSVADSMQALTAVCSQFLSAETVAARAELLDWLQCFIADPNSAHSAERLSACYESHRGLYELPPPPGAATLPADRTPARLQWLLKHQPTIGYQLNYLRQQQPGAAVAFMADTIWRAHNSPDGKLPDKEQWTEFSAVGGTWILTALDNSTSTHSDPDAILLRLQIDRIPGGAGVVYPCPATTAHLATTQDFRQAIGDAVQLVAAIAADFFHWDYCWKLAVIDDARDSDNQALRLEHELRGELVVCGLSGRSASLAFAAALLSSLRQIPIDDGIVSSAQFEVATLAAWDSKVKAVKVIHLKTLNSKSWKRREKTARLKSLMLFRKQQIPAVTRSLTILRVTDFRDAWNLFISRHTMTTACLHHLRASLERFSTDNGLRDDFDTGSAWGARMLGRFSDPQLRQSIPGNSTREISSEPLLLQHLLTHVDDMIRSSRHQRNDEQLQNDAFIGDPLVRIFMGHSGSGKTTLLHAVAITYADVFQANDQPPKAHVIPVFLTDQVDIQNRRFSESGMLDRLCSTVANRFTDSAGAEQSFTPAQIKEWVRQLLESGRLLLLIDEWHPQDLAGLITSLRETQLFSRVPILATVRESWQDTMLAQRVFGPGNLIHTTAFSPAVASDRLSRAGCPPETLNQLFAENAATGPGDAAGPWQNPLTNRLLCELFQSVATDTNSEKLKLDNQWDIIRQLFLGPHGWLNSAATFASVPATSHESLRSRLFQELCQQALPHFHSNFNLDRPLTSLRLEIQDVVTSLFPLNPAQITADLLHKLWVVCPDPKSQPQQLRWRFPRFAEYFSGARVAEYFLSDAQDQQDDGIDEVVRAHALPSSSLAASPPTSGQSTRWLPVFQCALWKVSDSPHAMNLLAAALISCGNPLALTQAATADKVQVPNDWLELATYLVSLAPTDQPVQPVAPPADSAKSAACSLLNDDRFRAQLYDRSLRDGDILAGMRHLAFAHSQPEDFETPWSELQSRNLPVALQRMLQQQYWSDTGWQAMTADPQLEIALFPVSRKHYSLFCPQHSLRPNNLQANSEGPVNNVTLNAAREFCHWLNAVSRCQKKHLEFQLPDATHLQTIRQTVQPGQHADFELCELRTHSGNPTGHGSGLAYNFLCDPGDTSAPAEIPRAAHVADRLTGFRVCRRRLAGT